MMVWSSAWVTGLGFAGRFFAVAEDRRPGKREERQGAWRADARWGDANDPSWRYTVDVDWGVPP